MNEDFHHIPERKNQNIVYCYYCVWKLSAPGAILMNWPGRFGVYWWLDGCSGSWEMDPIDCFGIITQFWWVSCSCTWLLWRVCKENFTVFSSSARRWQIFSLACFILCCSSVSLSFRASISCLVSPEDPSFRLSNFKVKSCKSEKTSWFVGAILRSLTVVSGLFGRE